MKPGYDLNEDKNERPICKLIGEDGNVFSIIGRVKRALRNAGMAERANEFEALSFKAGGYDEVLRLAMEYVEVE